MKERQNQFDKVNYLVAFGLITVPIISVSIWLLIHEMLRQSSIVWLIYITALSIILGLIFAIIVSLILSYNRNENICVNGIPFPVFYGIQSEDDCVAEYFVGINLILNIVYWCLVFIVFIYSLYLIFLNYGFGISVLFFLFVIYGAADLFKRVIKIYPRKIWRMTMPVVEDHEDNDGSGDDVNELEDLKDFEVHLKDEPENIPDDLKLNMLNEYVSKYYLDPNPDNSSLWIHCVDNSLLEEGSPESSFMVYFFSRLAQMTPGIIEQYQVLSENTKSTNEKRFVTTVLQLATGNREEPFLFKLNDRFPLDLKILDRKVECATDLDYLWIEFFLTGKYAVVKNIIKVFSWPDISGNKLQDWLSSTSGQSNIMTKFRLWRLRKALGDVIFDNTGQLRADIDLDTMCILNKDYGWRSAEKIEQIKELLPFNLSDDQIDYMATKAAAKWSIVANRSHERVINIYNAVKEGLDLRSQLRIDSLESNAFIYTGPPSFDKTIRNALTLEAIIGTVIVACLVFFGPALSQLTSKLVAHSNVIAWIGFVFCFVSSTLLGFVRQLFASLLSRAGALPVEDKNGKQTVLYIGDVPPEEWIRSARYRAGTWTLVTIFSLVSADLGSKLALNYFTNFEYVEFFLLILSVRWLLPFFAVKMVERG